ncbi:branched-chain amino acid ABC transporter permease [Desulfuromonas sp. TF]|uniref:branched-chain amino acid ABC transporter permease n=1 Tax=Desulfuromonas sp. TF TaxID=1232410 RepID=UPI000550C68A
MQDRDRWKPAEILFWIALLCLFFVFPTKLVFASQILITGLFALSLDLILGFGGIVTLGHAAFFGLGAYTAGLLATHGWQEPLSGLLAAGLVAGAAGYLSSFLLLRGGDLTRLMITLGIGLLLYEIANSASDFTGGVDGLQGVEIDKLFGAFSFDLYGRTSYLYVLGVSFVLFAVTRSMMHSPYGLALRSFRDNSTRALAIGIPVKAILTNIYTYSAVLAGFAGALLTQSTQFVSLDVLSFERSAELLIMLIIGGTATMYGGFVGAAVFMLVQDRLSNINPQYWNFWLGLLLVVMTLYLRGGILGGLGRLAQLPGRRRKKDNA